MIEESSLVTALIPKSSVIRGASSAPVLVPNCIYTHTLAESLVARYARPLLGFSCGYGTTRRCGTLSRNEDEKID
jgi:hypothetical protein